MKLRPHCAKTSWYYAMINSNKCLHVDVWLHAMGGTVYVHVEKRQGGRMLQRAVCYRVDDFGRTVHLTNIQPSHDLGQNVTMSDRAVLASPALVALLDQVHNAVHSMFVRPALGRAHSIRLHYVRVPSLEPLGEAENFFTYGAK